MLGVILKLAVFTNPLFISSDAESRSVVSNDKTLFSILPLPVVSIKWLIPELFLYVSVCVDSMDVFLLTSNFAVLTVLFIQLLPCILKFT